MSSTPLAALERSRLDFGIAAAQAKLALLKQLAHTRLGSARGVMRLHEALCYIRAYPDNPAVLEQVQAMLAAFDRRSDLRAHRHTLADSGIAGTAIHCRFFAGQAQWLAQRWPDKLQLDRREPGADERIARALPPLVTPAEASALIELKLPGYPALDRLRGPNETDATFLLRRIAAMPGDGFTREAFSDIVDAGFMLAPGHDTPSRTAAHFAAHRAPVVFRREAPPRVRPDLRAEIARAPRSLRRMPVQDGAAIIELARAAMVVRHRSLEAFSFADARDAWFVDHGDGLATPLVGVIPQRRHAVASWYGGLTLRNGVPVGYHQADIVGCSAALSFNTFDTFRGGEAAFTFARWLAALRHVFGTTSFSIDPYQLGNDEALESGAWWFYAKLGFRPRDAATAKLARDELARVERSPRHRTRAATLRRLAERHLFFDLEPAHPPPLFPLAALGLSSGAALSARAGSDRERAVDDASTELLHHCGLASLQGFSPGQREAWRRLAPIITLLDLGAWQDDERRALVDVIRAKGGRSERDYVARYLAHPKLDAVLRQVVLRPTTE